MQDHSQAEHCSLAHLKTELLPGLLDLNLLRLQVIYKKVMHKRKVKAILLNTKILLFTISRNWQKQGYLKKKGGPAIPTFYFPISPSDFRLLIQRRLFSWILNTAFFFFFCITNHVFLTLEQLRMTSSARSIWYVQVFQQVHSIYNRLCNIP